EQRPTSCSVPSVPTQTASRQGLPLTVPRAIAVRIDSTASWLLKKLSSVPRSSGDTIPNSEKLSMVSPELCGNYAASWLLKKLSSVPRSSGDTIPNSEKLSMVSPELFYGVPGTILVSPELSALGLEQNSVCILVGSLTKYRNGPEDHSM